MKSPFLKSFRLKNFKAIRDSKAVRLTPLTVFIGNNGSGKSSLIEGMETLQDIVEHGLDEAMHRWRGFEQIWHKGQKPKLRTPPDQRSHYTGMMSFSALARAESQLNPHNFTITMDVGLGPGGNELFIYRESITASNESWGMNRDDKGHVTFRQESSSQDLHRDVPDGESAFDLGASDFIKSWQFVTLNPQMMGELRPQQRTGVKIRLNKDGSNIAEYLLSIRKLDQSAFDGIIETLQYVLPYASDLQPTLTSELERSIYLQLKESDFEVPGWLLSTGTLRIVALLALLRHPTPPPIIVIEELENGLDPRTIDLLVDEIRNVVESNRAQVIITTHSPYLLDLLLLEHIVVVDRVDGQPTFNRPADQESLEKWAEKFSPGRLYTMNLLNRKEQQ
jgi:predicted ATPase